MPAIPRQRRYDQVMGDREPKVADKRFVLELQQRLEDKYLTSQCLKERKLAEAESRRVRKLVLDGIIDPVDSHRDHGASGKGQNWREFWPPNPHKTLAEYQEEKKRKAEESARSGQQQEQENAHQEPRQETAAPAHGQPASSAAGGGGDGGERQQAAAGGGGGRYDAAHSPRIDELMAEENLDELYRRAAGIVFVMAAPQRAAGKTKAKH